jgi:DNA-binding protein HU-beta
MNKQHVIEIMALASGITQREAKLALNAFTDAVQVTLQNNGKVSLVGFGNFSTRHRAERIGRNPQTGEPLTIPAANIPEFKASKSLKDSCNKV